MNKEKLKEKAKEFDYVIGCYDVKIDNLSKKELRWIIDNITGDYTDVPVTLNGEKCIVEIAYVDNEIDFNFVSKNEYINRYGREQYENVMEKLED